MKRMTVAVAIAATLLLTGCTAATEPQPATSTSAGEVSASTPPDAAPAQVAPQPSPTIDLDAEFLATSLVSQIDLDDEAKLAAAHYACEQVAGGNLGVVALEGVTEQLNRVFVGSAIVYYCPELSDVYTAG